MPWRPPYSTSEKALWSHQRGSHRRGSEANTALGGHCRARKREHHLVPRAVEGRQRPGSTGKLQGA